MLFDSAKCSAQIEQLGTVEVQRFYRCSAYRGPSDNEQEVSTAEFVSKIEGGLPELEETAYWLELLRDAGIMPEARLVDLCKEVDELTAVLVSSAKTAKRQGK